MATLRARARARAPAPDEVFEMMPAASEINWDGETHSAPAPLRVEIVELPLERGRLVSIKSGRRSRFFAALGKLKEMVPAESRVYAPTGPGFVVRPAGYELLAHWLDWVRHVGGRVLYARLDRAVEAEDLRSLTNGARVG